MMKYIKYIFVVILTLSLSSCYFKKNVALLQERDNLPQYEKGEFQEYKLQANDEIEIRVVTANKETAALFNQGKAANGMTSYPYRIYEDGTIDIAFVNNIPIVGLTIEEAEKVIQQKLIAFVDDIQVKLALATGTFCVIGDAGRGYFSIYKERLTIYQALALAGGVNDSGNFKGVKIMRTVGGETKIMEFDLRSKSIINSEFYYIYPNDVIYVDASKKRFWAVNSYAAFLGVVTSSINLLMTTWSLFK